MEGRVKENRIYKINVIFTHVFTSSINIFVTIAAKFFSFFFVYASFSFCLTSFLPMYHFDLNPVRIIYCSLLDLIIKSHL